MFCSSIKKAKQIEMPDESRCVSGTEADHVTRLCIVSGMSTAMNSSGSLVTFSIFSSLAQLLHIVAQLSFNPSRVDKIANFS